MFDLNEAIGAWRRRMGANPDIQEGDLDELEDHLREGVADLRQGGLNEEEAFLVAARRLGDPEVLAGEFATADPGLRRRVRLRWMVVGALAILVLRFFGDVMADFLTGGMAFMNAGPQLLGWTSGILRLTILLVGGLLFWRLLASDAAAGRIRKLGIWSAGVMSMLLVSLALLIGAASLRGGSGWLLGVGVHSSHLPAMSLITYWFRAGLLLLLPLLLLLLLWLLARPRGKTR